MVACTLWVVFYFDHRSRLEDLLETMILIHIIAWIFFIGPFAIFVPETSRVYDFRYSVFAGPLFAVAAMVAYGVVISLLQGGRLRLSFLFVGYPFTIGCAISGTAVAVTMSACRAFFRKFPVRL